MPNANWTALLGMPGYGQLTAGAGRGFWRATRHPERVQYQYQEGSLLAANFNRLWCAALNRHRAGKCDYFAMQHADVEPQDGWLDLLIEELESRELDVLGVAVPIKDPHGLTSLAVAHPTGDTWRVKGRLTMRELYRLPPTFTSDDVGGPLLLNTGLWVSKLGEWSRKVHFQICDRIVWNEAAGEYQPQVEPEDWFFSRLCHEQGVRIGATRKVALAHAGSMRVRNTHPWGDLDHDFETGPGGLLPAAAPDGWRFPDDVAGWLTEAEGRELARLAAGKDVLEVGSYGGRSAVCMAQTARSVSCVDTFDGRGTPNEGRTGSLFRRNVERYGVESRVRVYAAESADVLPRLPPVYDLCFVDGSHDYDSVMRDAGLAARLLRAGGLLAFHDYMGNEPGVTRAVDELRAAGAELVSITDTLAVLKPPSSTGE